MNHLYPHGWKLAEQELNVPAGKVNRMICSSEMLVHIRTLSQKMTTFIITTVNISNRSYVWFVRMNSFQVVMILRIMLSSAINLCILANLLKAHMCRYIAGFVLAPKPEFKSTGKHIFSSKKHWVRVCCDIISIDL